MYLYIYIYIYRERERERYTYTCIHIYKYIYIYIYISVSYRIVPLSALSVCPSVRASVSIIVIIVRLIVNHSNDSQ